MARYERNRYGSIVLNDYQGNKFTITPKEQKELKILTKRANQRRYDRANKYYNDTKNQVNMKGISKEVYTDMLQSKGVITEKYSSSFKQFNSKEDFKEYMKELKTVTKRGYGSDYIKDIRKSMINRVNSNYGHDGQNIIDLINNISDTKLMSIYIHNDDIIKTLYGSIENSQDSIDSLVNKTESDIHYFLNTTRRK